MLLDMAQWEMLQKNGSFNGLEISGSQNSDGRSNLSPSAIKDSINKIINDNIEQQDHLQ